MPEQFWDEIEPREFALMLIAARVRYQREYRDRQYQQDQQLVLLRHIAVTTYNAHAKKVDRIRNVHSFYPIYSEQRLQRHWVNQRPQMTQSRLAEIDSRKKRNRKKQ